jgi:hypothetical protein
MSKSIQVDNCYNCPFKRTLTDSDSYETHFCGATEDSRQIKVNDHIDKIIDPEWCPLTNGSHVTVSLVEKKAPSYLGKTIIAADSLIEAKGRVVGLTNTKVFLELDEDYDLFEKKSFEQMETWLKAKADYEYFERLPDHQISDKKYYVDFFIIDIKEVLK